MPQELTVFIAVDFLRTFFALVESRKDGLCKSLRHCLNHNPLKAKLNFTFPLDVCFQTKMNILLCQWECSLTFSALPATPSFGCGHNGKTKKQRLQKKKKNSSRQGVQYESILFSMMCYSQTSLNSYFSSFLSVQPCHPIVHLCSTDIAG